MRDYAYRWFTALVGLALISVVLVAGATAADRSIRPDDRATHGPGALVSGAATDLVRPDDRATHGPGSVTETAIVAQATSRGVFDWIDAGVGAAGLAGLGLIGAGAAALLVRRRRSAAFS